MQYLYQFLFTLLAVIVVFLLKNYYPKYFETKGANQATKEDIGEITEIVESIKSDLNRKVEELKAQLSLINQHKLTMKASEIEAFFEYNKALSAKINFLVNYSFPAYKVDEFEKVASVLSEVAIRSNNLDNAESHLFLFYRDRTFLQLKGKIHIGIIALEGRFSDCVFDIEKILREAYYEIKANPSNTAEIMKQMRAKWSEAVEKYRKDKLSAFKEIHSMHYDMMDLIYERLANIDEQMNKL